MGLLKATLSWLLPLAARAALPSWLGAPVLWLYGALCFVMFVTALLLYASDESVENCLIATLQSTALSVVVAKLLEAPIRADGKGPSRRTITFYVCMVAALVVALHDRCDCGHSSAGKVCRSEDFWAENKRNVQNALEDLPPAFVVFLSALGHGTMANYESVCALTCQLSEWA